MEYICGSKKKTLIVIVGPTAVGKTKWAVHLAHYLNAQIVSADSRQLYKEMVIGVSRPSDEEQRAIPHHFIGSRSIFEEYNAGRYEREALHLITHLFEASDYQILCGGSGMYVKAICEGFDDMPQVLPLVRKSIVEEYKKRGLEWLQEQVKKNDPSFFREVDQQNSRRLLRALELYRTTGKSVKILRKNKKKERPFSMIKIGLIRDKKELYDRIDARIDQMLKEGLIEEVRALSPHRDRIALQTVGYQEFFPYFDGLCTLDDAIQKLKQNTRKYAKRQLTWFKKDKQIKWFHAHAEDEIMTYINHLK